jgi:hypothetical protein
MKVHEGFHGLETNPNYKLLSLNLSKIANKLGMNRLGLKGVQMLSQCRLPSLQKLELSECWIGNDPSRHLTKCFWPHLLYLNLSTL